MTSMILTQDQITESLRPVFRVYNVKKATLFGSYAKNTADSVSDVDLLVDSGLQGMRFVGLMESIKEALGGKEIDLLDKSHIDEYSDISNEINKTGVLIYEGR